FDQRIDRSRTIVTDRLPAGSFDRRDGDVNPVEIRTSDHRGDLTLGYLKVDHGTVADVGASARQALLIVAVAVEVCAPRLAPETFGNRAALDLHGSYGPSPLLQLGHLAFRLPALLGHRNIGSPCEVVGHPSALLHRRTQVERHETQQFLILHFGQRHVSPAAEEIPSQLLLRLDHLVDFILHRAATDELVDKHVFGLPDEEGGVGRLVFHSRIPPPIEMDGMRSRGEIEPRPASLDGEHEEWDAFVLLKLAHQILALPDLGLAVQDEAGAPEHGAEECREWRGHLLELRE